MGPRDPGPSPGGGWGVTLWIATAILVWVVWIASCFAQTGSLFPD